jgi:hypothetical protein
MKPALFAVAFRTSAPVVLDMEGTAERSLGEPIVQVHFQSLIIVLRILSTKEAARRIKLGVSQVQGPCEFHCRPLMMMARA